jgi:myo-inositol-1(or 4)-monophosphatase
MQINRLEFAISITRVAREIAMSRWNRGMGFTTKSSGIDLVTKADEEINDLLTTSIRNHFPGEQILAEESAQEVSMDGAVWFVDPIDGTTNYAHGFPVVGITVAFWDGTNMLVGVVCDVVRNRCYTAEKGKGAFRDGVRLRVSSVRDLKSSLLATGFPYDRAETEDNNLREFAYFMPKVQGVRRAGAATLDMAWIAEGRLDGYWEQKLKPWDWAAGSLLVEEAGGMFTDYEGNPWRPGISKVIASNGLIHDALVQGIAEARKSLQSR